MAEKETGWTKTYPSLRYGSWFWLRDSESDTPRLTQLCGGYNFYEPMGIVSPTTEYLGPVTASDAEQLSELRKLAQRLMEAAQFSLSTPGLIRGRDQLKNCMEAVAVVLNQPEKETQGK